MNSGSPHERRDPRRWLALAVLLSATLLGVLDFLIVNIAVPSIRKGLGATDAEIQLTIAGYGLAFAVCLITGGRLGDIYGRKKMFLIGMGLFTAASALCGLSQTPSQLVGFRILQGLVAALMSPQVLAIIQVTYSGKERDLATGIMGAVVGIGSFVGNVFGGWLVGANIFGLGWRPIFFVNVPIGIIAMACASKLLHESRAEQARKLDVPGALLCGAGLFCLIFPLAEGRERGWPLWSFGMLAGAAVIGAIFVRYEDSVARNGGSPLLDLALFRQKAFTQGLTAVLVMFGGMGSFALTMTIFLQDGLKQSPQRTGMIFGPLAVAFLLSSLCAVKLAVKLGAKVLFFGLMTSIAGMSAMLFLVLHYKGDLNPLWLLPAIFVYGIGQGSTIPRLIRTTLNSVSHENAGAASGLLSTTQQVAFSIGVSLIGSLFFTLVGKEDEATPTTYAHAWAVAQACSIVCFAVTLGIVSRLVAAETRAARQASDTAEDEMEPVYVEAM